MLHAVDVDRNFFPRFPNSKQKNPLLQIKKDLHVISRKELEQTVLDVMEWFGGLAVDLSHTYANLEKETDTINRSLKLFLDELIGEPKSLERAN